MKKICTILFLSAILSLSLAACQPNAATDEPITTTDPVETVTPAPPVNDLIDIGDKTLAELTAREVVDDYLAGSNRLDAFREAGDDGWIQLYVPSAAVTRVNLNHLYPESTWTPEDIVASFTNKTAPWLDHTVGYYQYSGGSWSMLGTRYKLWDQTLEHEFMIYDGWLYINDVRALPIDCETCDSLDPMDLVAAYQGGTWDGSRIYNATYDTYAVLVDGEASICYKFYRPLLGDVVERDLYYDGYNTEPWWTAEDHDYGIEASSRYSNNKRTSASISIYGVFPDLPNGTLDGSVTGDPLRIQPVVVDVEAGMTRVASTDGVWKFSKGTNTDRWSIQSDATNSYLYDPWWMEDYDMYLYTGSQFVKLRDGGQIEIVIPQTAGFYTGYESYCAPYFIEDGALKRLDVWGSEPTETVTVIREQVVECTGFNRLFVTLEDGNVYSFLGGRSSENNPDLPSNLTLLGNAGDAQFYLELWRAFDGSWDDFVQSVQGGSSI